MPANIELLNTELKKLSDICIKIKPWVEGGLLDHRVLETQHSIQVERLAKLKAEADQVEERVKNTVKNAEFLEEEAKKKDRQLDADRNIKWIKLNQKFKEVETRIEDADRKVIKGMLKELEKVA